MQIYSRGPGDAVPGGGVGAEPPTKICESPSSTDTKEKAKTFSLSLYKLMNMDSERMTLKKSRILNITHSSWYEHNHTFTERVLIHLFLTAAVLRLLSPQPTSSHSMADNAGGLGPWQSVSFLSNLFPGRSIVLARSE